MTSPQQIEILDLRHFTARQLRPLLEQEAATWLKRLRWDYRSSTDLLLQYLDSRILPGFVALDRGRICGYTFFVYEGAKAVVGDLYASQDAPAPLAIADTLSRHLLETLFASPEVNRIEAQLLLYEAGVLAALFPSFTMFPRLFMEKTLSRSSSASQRGARAVPREFELLPWAAGYYQASAELIRACYAGHIDSDINDQYRTLQGSLRFLHNVVRFPGCGVFDPESSWVLRERASNALVGIILCSRVTPAGPDGPIAHVTQLCVDDAFRGQNLGRLLIEHCLQRLPSREYRALTLTVSEGNTAALELYLSAGFEPRQRFDALVYDKALNRVGKMLKPARGPRLV